MLPFIVFHTSYWLLYVENPVIYSFVSPFTAIVTAYETNTQHDPNNNNAMLGVHASASAIIQYGKIGRKQVRILAFTAIFNNANFHSNCFSRFVHFLVC